MSNATSFQYASDIHTEMYKFIPDVFSAPFFLEVKAPYLLLAGDIGYPFHKNYFEFLQQLTPYYKHIFLTTGNHEYYQSKFERVGPQQKSNEWMTAVDNRVREISQSFSNVTFLQNTSVLIPETNLRIFGGTFWSDIKPEEEHHILRSLNDYRHIPSFTPAKSRALFQESQEALAKELEIYPAQDFLVMSHHLPSYDLVAPQYRNLYPPINSAFASDIPLANNPRILAWVAGHTHSPMELGKFHVNPFGYPRENMRYATLNKSFQV